MAGLVFWWFFSGVFFVVGCVAFYAEAMNPTTRLNYHWAVWVSPWNISDDDRRLVQTLPVGGKQWVRSGGGCRYLWERLPNDPPPFHRTRLARVVSAKPGWVPCQKAEWWQTGTIVYDEDRPS